MLPDRRWRARARVCARCAAHLTLVSACGTYLGNAEELVEVGARFAPLFRHCLCCRAVSTRSIEFCSVLRVLEFFDSRMFSILDICTEMFQKKMKKAAT